MCVDKVAPTATLEASDAADARLIEAVEDFIPHAMRVTGTPGLNVALARRGKLIWEEGFGFADLARKSPMTPRTLTRAGSISKLYAATATLQLVESGQIGLYDPVQPYVSDIRVVNPLGEREVTVYDLLTYRSGLATDTFDASLETPPPLAEHLRRGYEDETSQEYHGAVPRWTAKVGQRYQYSSFGIATLGHLVGRVNRDGLTFSDYVKRQIFDPLGMASSALPSGRFTGESDAEMLARVSTGYARFGNVCVPSPPLRSASYPAIGLLTTPGDHIRLLLALLEGGIHRGRRVLEEQTVQLMLTPQTLAEAGSDAGMWFGLEVEMNRLGHKDFFFGHVGAHVWGWWGDSRAYPALDCAIVVFTNAWDMMRYHNPSTRCAPGLVAEFVSSWIQREDPLLGAPRKAVSAWAWRRSYVMGVVLFERTAGLLAVNGALSAETLEASGTGTRAPDGVKADFDPAGFRAGLIDMSQFEMTPTGIKAFLDSDRLRVPRAEFRLHCLDFGARLTLPLPLAFWADAMESSQPLKST